MLASSVTPSGEVGQCRRRNCPRSGSDDGGTDSERVFIKQLVQKYINDGSSDELFNEEKIESNNVGV